MKKILSVQKWFDKRMTLKIPLLVIIMIASLLIIRGCGNSSESMSLNTINSGQNKLSSPDEKSTYVRYSSFQNPDSTWGFTIFVNSRPFLLYKKIPVNKSESGFATRKDAESVGALFMKMVKNGDTSPKLTKKALDTLGIILNKR